LIGGKIDLDLLSLFPQNDARNMGGMERESKLLKVNNGGEREGVATAQGGRRGPFIGLPTKLAVGGHFLRSFRPLGGGDSGQGLKSLRPHLCAERHLKFSWSGDLGRSLRSLGAEDFGLEKYPEVPGQNSG
jgi:hypothetical protein